MSDAQHLGHELREAREARELTLEQAEEQTRIRIKFLDALEQGNYAALPTEVQARGFLRNYARFLGLDPDIILDKYEAARTGRRRRRRRANPSAALPPSALPVEPPVPSSPSATPTRRSQTARAVEQGAAEPAVPAPVDHNQQRRLMILLGGIGLALGLAILCGLLFIGAQIVQGYLHQGNRPGVILSPLPQDTTPTMFPTFRLAPTSSPQHPTALPVPNAAIGPSGPGNSANTAAPSGSGPVALQLTITERGFLRVTVDGQVSYSGSAPPNTVLQYQGSAIQVHSANAAGVQVTVNGQNLGTLGARGQMVDQTYTASGANSGGAQSPPGPTRPASGQTTGLNINTSPLATFALRASDSSATPRPRFSPTATVLPTITPSQTFTNTPLPSATPSASNTPTITLTPSSTYTPSATRTPADTPTASLTPVPSDTYTPTNTPFILSRDTATPDSGEIRPQ
ncbi:MAG TPA: RodZ domain-containing protein [Aggregatilineales bacterium]|nr:RodZ domain-containing protein [Aggregatilineales bacterium]